MGQRWFHNAGGGSPFQLEPLSSRYLSFDERMQIEYLLSQNAKVREIARVLDRHPSSISREIRRNAATRICGGSVGGPHFSVQVM